MTNDYVNVHSPLETRISDDSMSVEILIYRGKDQSEWVLEVVDHLGGSTLWDQLFPTDEVAYNAATTVIENQGIASFTSSESRNLH